MNKSNSFSQFFDHLRFDFNIRGIIIFNANAGMQRVYVAGYPYPVNDALNDNEVLG